jgi:biotin carboxylase
MWLIDESISEMREMSGFLNRFGSVVNIDGFDESEVALAVSASRRPDAVITFLDKNMTLLAGVAEILGIPFQSVESAKALTDKAYQRIRLAEAGLDSTRCQVLTSEEISTHQVHPDPDLGWPVVLKPRSSQGSHYTFFAKDADQLNSLLKLIATDCPEMILESYIPDDYVGIGEPYASYVSVESIVSVGEISHLAITGRFPLAENFRETGFFIPAKLNPTDQLAVLELASSAIAALGVSTGSLHTEIKLTAGGPRIVEVNGRVGGGVPEMLSRATGTDLLAIIFNIALGGRTVIKGPLETSTIGYRFFLQPPPVSAVVSSIEGLDALNDHPGVDAISIHQRPGDELDWKDGSRNHILSVVGSATSYEDLQSVSRTINEVVKVSYTNIRRN